MAQWMRDSLQYYGAVAATLAALVVALNLGRRITGWGFVLFVSSSLALIGWGFAQPHSEGIGWQNIALLAINAVGVYRYLIRGHGRTQENARTVKAGRLHLSHGQAGVKNPAGAEISPGAP